MRKNLSPSLIKTLAAITLICSSISTHADDRFAKVTIDAQRVQQNVYVVYGSGGNIGVLADANTSLMIDDQFEPLAPKIEQAIEALDEKPGKISYVVNTHYHGDHTGSNAYFSKTASVLAHENVRKRLAQKSAQGLPVITYSDGVKLHIGEETVHVKHLKNGHTDGDSVVYFEKANVWHLGDLFFESRFPYIDLNSGGSLAGYIENLQHLLMKIDDDAPIIPGHGSLTNKAGLQSSLSMILGTAAEVRLAKQNGQTLEQILKSGLDEKWSEWSWNFITEEKWIRTLYQEL
jgi:glyoxylase-like metal-dependent hydrolase (beta-lactamase superfamily II)